MEYNATFLDNTPVIPLNDLNTLETINKSYPLSEFLSNNRMVEEMGIDFIHSSAQIEGNTYDRFDTLTLLKLGQTAGNKKFSDAQVILNIREAYNDMLKLNKDINIDLIKDVHFTMSNNLLPESQRGSVRKGGVRIGGSSYRPISDSNRLNAELNYIVSKYKDIKCPYSAAIYLHLNICYLQYFEDYNKRTARQLQNTSLTLDTKLPLLFSEANSLNYIKSVLKYYETGDSSSYIKWFVDTYIATWR